jgi:hypothetical protein
MPRQLNTWCAFGKWQFAQYRLQVELKGLRVVESFVVYVILGQGTEPLLTVCLAQVRKSRLAMAIYLHQFHKHCKRPYPPGKVAVERAINHQLLFGFAVLCQAQHFIERAFVVAVNTQSRKGQKCFHLNQYLR